MLGTTTMLQPGEWLCQDSTAFELGLMAPRGTIEVEPYPKTMIREPQSFFGRADACTSILIIRSGAIGDLLLLSPAIEALQKDFPDTEITLSCFAKHFPMLQAIPNLRLVNYPPQLAFSGPIQSIVSLENVIELAPDKHAIDAFAEALGVTMTDYKPVYHVSEIERETALIAFPTTGRKRIALHVRASTKNRDYPFPKWAEIILTLAMRGHDVFLFGGKGQIPPFKSEEPIVGTITDTSHLSIREAAALLSTCDAFAGVDSCFIHFCHALDIPAIGLFSVFPWQTRTSKAPKTHVLQATGECAPCHWLAQAGSHFPPNKPCTSKGYCTVLAQIEPQKVIAKIERLL